MRKWFINFEGYCVVQADTKEKAEDIFYEDINPPMDSRIYNEFYTVTDIAEVGEEGEGEAEAYCLTPKGLFLLKWIQSGRDFNEGATIARSLFTADGNPTIEGLVIQD